MLVAAGHAARDRDRTLAGAHVVLVDQALGILAHLVGADEAAFLEARLLIALEDQILLQRKIEDQAILMPVLRDVAHVLQALVDGAVGDVLPAERDAAAGGLVQTGEPVDQLGLAVAVDARDADDLPRAHVERDVVHGVLFVQVRGDAQVLHAEHHVRGLRVVLIHHELDGAADHHVRKRLLVRLGGVHRANVFALAQDGHAVGHGHDLVELVRDEEDALPLLGEILHDLHQLVDLLRSEHGGRLVEDEDLIVAIEHLENLDALLHADGDVLHLRVQIHLQPVALGQLLHLFARFLLLQEAQLCRFRAEDDIVQHRENVDELEVLMHHADAQRRRVVGVADLHRLAVFADLALLGLIQAEQHAHQRGFARAVFPQKRVDLRLFQLQGDVVIRLDAGKLLGDVKHFDHILRSVCHVATYFPP